MRSFLPPALLFVLILGLVPAMGTLTPKIRELLGSAFIPTVTVAVGVIGVAVFTWLFRTLRGAGPRRIGLLVAAVAIIAVEQLTTERNEPYVEAVERVHIVLYGGLAILLHRAFHRTWSNRSEGSSSPGLEVSVASMLAVACASLVDEGVQWSIALRTGEAYDLLYNLYAGTCGLLAAAGLWPVAVAWRPSASARRLLGALGVVVSLGAGAFVETAHLGHLLVDEDIGGFRSFYSRSGLIEADAVRAERWRDAPPNRPFAPFDLEDPYQTEAAWHVQVRNSAWHDGQLELAWFENRILERYYSSFLELARDRTGGLYSLHPAEREQLAAEFGDRSADDFVSWAHNHRIWIRPPRAVLWSIVLASAVGWLVYGLWPKRRAS